MVHPARTINRVSNIQTNAYRAASAHQRVYRRAHVYSTTTSRSGPRACRRDATTKMIKYITERPIPEARDLDENCHHRSYAGDEYGPTRSFTTARRASTWPHARRSDTRGPSWRRRSARSAPRCSARPSVAPRAVQSALHCAAHGDGAVGRGASPWCMTRHFRDTLAELREIASHVGTHLQCAWYEAEAFECRDARYEIAGPHPGAHGARVPGETRPTTRARGDARGSRCRSGTRAWRSCTARMTCGDLGPTGVRSTTASRRTASSTP